MAMAQHTQQMPTGNVQSPELKFARAISEGSDASTAAPKDLDWSRMASSDSSISDAGSELRSPRSETFEDSLTSDDLMPGFSELKEASKKGMLSALLAILVLPALLAWLCLPSSIALALMSFYAVAMLSCAIVPDVVARGGCVGMLLPCVYILGAMFFMAKQIPPL